MSRMLRSLAVLGAGLGGFARGLDENEEAARRKKDDAWREEERAYQREQRARAQRMEQGVADAMTPREPNPVYPINDDEGNRMPAFEQKYTVPGADGALTGPAARAAAEQANSRQARMGRVYDAMAGGGDIRGAEALRTHGMQADAAEIQLKAAKTKEVNDAYNADLFSRATDWASLEQFMNETKGDGQGGAFKVKFLPDGKMMVAHKVGPDGALSPTPVAVPNNQQGLQTMIGTIGLKLPPEQKLAHLQGIAKSEEDKRRWEADFGLRESGEKRRAANDDARLGIERQRVGMEGARLSLAREVAATKQAGGADAGLTLADLKDGHKAIASTLNADYKSQIDGALKPEDATPIKRTREAEIADVQRLYTGAMMSGMALTPEQAIAAYRTGTRRSGSAKTADGKTVKIEGIEVGGRFIPMADAPGAAVVAAPAPAKPAKDPPPIVPARSVPSRMSAPAAPADPFEAARAESAAAYQRLAAYGSRQRQADPQGFAAAKVAYEQAKAREQAMAAQIPAGAQSGAAFRYPAP